jgi:hypothetical protein
MCCHYCQKDPGRKKHNSLWKGFLDKDMDVHVCNGCKALHYRTKFKLAGMNGLYSEFPVLSPSK